MSATGPGRTGASEARPPKPAGSSRTGATTTAPGASWASKRFTVTPTLLPYDGGTYYTDSTWGNVTTKQVYYWLEAPAAQLANPAGLVMETHDFGSGAKTYVRSDYHSQPIDVAGDLEAKQIEGVTYAGANNKPNSGTVTEYNFFYNRDRFTLSFNTRGGTAIDAKTDVMYGEELSGLMPPDPTRQTDGLDDEFCGWYWDAEYNLPVDFTVDPVPTMPNNNQMLFAK